MLSLSRSPTCKWEIRWFDSRLGDRFNEKEEDGCSLLSLAFSLFVYAACSPRCRAWLLPPNIDISYGTVSYGSLSISIRQWFVALYSLWPNVLMRQCFSNDIASHGISHRLTASGELRGNAIQQLLRQTQQDLSSRETLAVLNWLFSTGFSDLRFRTLAPISPAFSFRSSRATYRSSQLLIIVAKSPSLDQLISVDDKYNLYVWQGNKSMNA